MTKKPILETLRERRLVCDGAMGTQLMLAGLESGSCGELWNLTHAERVLEIQRRYAQAGTDCIITNTFGGSRIAREAFGDREGFVLGDIGPVGAILEPYGDLSQADASAALEEQATALVEA